MQVKEDAEFQLNSLQDKFGEACKLAAESFDQLVFRFNAESQKEKGIANTLCPTHIENDFTHYCETHH